MKILFVSVEVAPFAKVGGLADVAGSLPQALAALGHDVRILMPAYGMVVDVKPDGAKLAVKIRDDWKIDAKVWNDDVEGVPVWMVGSKEFFLPTERSEEVYAYGQDAYLFFAQAALSLCEDQNWIPDIVHANDWHTGFLPVFVREKGGPKWKNTASIFTIHNLLYQGTFGPEVLTNAGLPSSLFTSDKLETWGGVNFIKSACVFSDQVNTVSPTYAKEITTEQYGAGLWGLMRDLDQLGKLRGILNGINYNFFNPSTDTDIAATFSAEDMSGKAKCKAALQKELGLPVNADVPVFGIVSRLSDQKGFDIILRQAYGMLAEGAQFIALGTGDPWAASELQKLQDEWPDQVSFTERYDGPLAQRIYAGSDVFLMPSAFEPCGLGQMIACRYGTLPIVRKTGGLADSIVEGENGFVMFNISAKELFNTVSRVGTAFKDKANWTKHMKSAMTTDFGWKISAVKYVEMYEDALKARLGAELISK
jgi:starch synthase